MLKLLHSFFVFILLLTACDPVPSRTLTPEEKAADMAWLYSIFNENYAPLQYKEERHGFQFEELKAFYLDEATATEDNLSFYRVMHQFVSEFHDVHTCSILTPSNLPGRTEVAHLGFSGKRVGEVLVVTDLLPNFASFNPPIREYDEILALNGQPLTAIVLEEMVKQRNLGSEEANLTYHMNKIFNRRSLDLPIPEVGEMATLTIRRMGKEFTIDLEWVVQDLQAFLNEQEKAACTCDHEIAGLQASTYFATLSAMIKGKTARDIGGMFGGMLKRRTKSLFPDDFIFIDHAPCWNSPTIQRLVHSYTPPPSKRHPEIGTISLAPAEVSNQNDLRYFLSLFREVPSHAIFVSEAQTFPTYVTWEEASQEGVPGHYVAYMRIDTFSPDAWEEDILLEFEETLDVLQANHVHDLVIDLIDNGGGSISLCMHLARLLSPKPLELPETQLKTSDSWYNEFEWVATKGKGWNRAVAEKVWREMKKDRKEGRPITRSWPIDILMPHELDEGNSNLYQPFNLVVLVNEMSASASELFSGTLQDNGLATIIGSRTMGAGGNVVMHFQAPNSHLLVHQTESLLVRKDGSYLENNGVTPDIEVDVNADCLNNYTGIRRLAIDTLLNRSPLTQP